jgi:hypothetical protein
MSGSSISGLRFAGREAFEGGIWEEIGAEGTEFVEPWPVAVVAGVVRGLAEAEGISDGV